MYYVFLTTSNLYEVRINTFISILSANLFLYICMSMSLSLSSYSSSLLQYLCFYMCLCIKFAFIKLWYTNWLCDITKLLQINSRMTLHILPIPFSTQSQLYQNQSIIHYRLHGYKKQMQDAKLRWQIAYIYFPLLLWASVCIYHHLLASHICLLRDKSFTVCCYTFLNRQFKRCN